MKFPGIYEKVPSECHAKKSYREADKEYFPQKMNCPGIRFTNFQAFAVMARDERYVDDYK